MTYDWESLTKTATYQKLLNEWKNLLNNKRLKEKDYHAFLKEHPAVFLTLEDSYVSISKLKLGAEFETDFVIVKEGYSNGTVYEIIEIESPHTKLFDNSGKPSAKFNSALQQVRDWRRWFIDNKSEFKRVLPTINTKVLRESKLKFKIIIGRRTDNILDLEKRKQIEDEQKVEIISFDRLTEISEKWRFFFNESSIVSAQMDFDVSYEKANQLANPFYRCLNDSEWRSLAYRGEAHFHTGYLDKILNLRTHNSYFDKYKEEVLKG